MSDEKLTRDDLILLMESYRNVISMHQTILGQTSKTIEKIDNITNKQDSLLSKQNSIYTSLQTITSNLNNIYCDKINVIQKDINEKMEGHEKKSIEQYGAVINKIHLGWVGMGTIIITLMGLIISIKQ